MNEKSDFLELPHELIQEIADILLLLKDFNSLRISARIFSSALSTVFYKKLKEAYGIKSMAAGSSHTLFLEARGELSTCGYNINGQLGRALLPTENSSPKPLHALPDVKKIYAAYNQSFAIKSDGTKWAWGNNIKGQLGVGHTNKTNTPTAITTNEMIDHVSSGFGHSFFYKKRGNALASGNNTNNQLGFVGARSYPSPHLFPAIDDDEIIQIATGRSHTLILRASGNVSSFGENKNGQLGHGDTRDKPTPTLIKELSNVVAIAAGEYHSLFQHEDGTVSACGYNLIGQLGLGPLQKSNILKPQLIPGLADISQISAGGFHSLFLKNNDTVFGCGANDHGQLGLGNKVTQYVPSEIVSKSKKCCFITAGYNYSLIQMDDIIWGFGDNQHGQLGLSNHSDYVSPTPIDNVNDWIKVAARLMKKDGTFLTDDDMIISTTPKH